MRSKTSNLAGTWYPRDARRLQEEVDGLLAAARTEDGEPPLAAAVVPHAAYRYSGRAAAHAYARVGIRPPGRVVVLAPSHFHPFAGVAVADFDAFETPLGQVHVDRGTVSELQHHPLVRSDPEPFQREHALEIQLPFLQRVCPGALLVPVLVGELRQGDGAALAGALASVLDTRTLVVVSSDFTHYGVQFGYLPFPPRNAEAVREQLERLDRGAIECILRGDAGGFRRYIAATGATVCGRMPISILLEMRAGRGGGRLLSYYTSLDVTGDYEHSVSYAAVAFPAA